MNAYLSTILTCSCITILVLTPFDARAFETAGGLPQLGHYPLCEASAARFVSCPAGQGNCLLVGDNEQYDKLFLLRGERTMPYAAAQQSLKLNDKEISDIEALVQLPSGEMLVFGSHSRNSKIHQESRGQDN